MLHRHHETKARATTPVPPTLRLDDLLAMTAEELERLYASASVPAIESVRGALRGRMLAVRNLPGPLAGWVRRWASSSLFPWRGKTFRPENDLRGRGINRVVSDRFELYPFVTFVGKSHAGDFDALHLDYDLPENPFFIRPIRDEIRELAPGLWLGQAYLELASGTHLVLYFGLTGEASS